jgi:hypothetical protein
MLGQGKDWRRYSPVNAFTSSREEFRMSKPLEVESECLIEWQSKLIGCVIVFTVNLGFQTEVKLLNGSAELSPRTETARGHPE